MSYCIPGNVFIREAAADYFTALATTFWNYYKYCRSVGFAFRATHDTYTIVPIY